MEQATNQFQNGLQLDTSPMVQGNNTLTDCLNGTIVTMNGEEVILQNDMGNRRVDNAYLPSGYQPVGIKEYGGIIYVASYNPITNKSQLGSFPSPQRRISSYDDGSLQFTTDINFPTEKKKDWGNLFFLTTDSQIFKLTNDVSLHVGDKFIVYGTIAIDGQIRGKGEISNYDNVENGKVYSPKNKRYTLSLGVSDSKNAFTDITDSLSRWEVEEPYALIEDFESNTTEYKRNRGYFIVPNVPKDFEQTIADGKVEEKRKLMATNTYSQKLIAPLCLKVTYNHITNFNFDIDGEKQADGTFTLTINGEVTYNCPDGAEKGKSTDDPIYEYYETGNIVDTEILNGFDLYKMGSDSAIQLSSIIEYGIPEFDGENYKVKIKKVYSGVTPTTGSRLDYILAVGEKGKYILGLSSKGSIDLNKIGSGDLDISTWRFYWNDGKLQINTTIEGYPKKGENFVDFTLKIGDISIQHDFIKLKTNINEEVVGLDPQKVYQTVFTYSIQNNLGLYKNKSGEFTTEKYVFTFNDDYIYWILTTPLFNEFYSGSTQIPNYAQLRDTNGNKIAINEIDPSKESYSFEQDWIKQKLIIGPNFKVSGQQEDDIESVISGSMISKENKNIEIIGTQTKNFTVSTGMDLNVDTTLYPDYIEWTSSFDDSKIQILNVESNISTVESLIKKEINKDFDFQFSEDSITHLDGLLTGSVSWKDIHVYPPMRITDDIIDGFDYVTTYLNEAQSHNYCSYSAIVLDGDHNKSTHYKALLVSKGNNYYFHPYRAMRNFEGYKIYEENEATYDGTNKNEAGPFSNLDFNKYLSLIDDYDPDKIFAYLYYIDNNSNTEDYLYYAVNWEDFMRGVSSDPRQVRNSVQSMLNKSRLFWKDSKGQWALVHSFLLNYNVLKDNSISEQFKSLFNSETIFCMHDTISSENFELYKANKMKSMFTYNPYGEEGNIWYELIITLSLGQDVDYATNLNPEGSILHFATVKGQYKTIIPITKIESSENFFDYVDNEISLKNIDIEHGLNVDSSGKLLSPDNIYIYKDEKLIRWDGAPFTSSKLGKENGRRHLVCKSVRGRGTVLSYNYDVYSESGYTNNMTYIRYDKHATSEEYNVPNVDANKLKYND